MSEERRERDEASLGLVNPMVCIMFSNSAMVPAIVDTQARDRPDEQTERQIKKSREGHTGKAHGTEPSTDRARE